MYIFTIFGINHQDNQHKKLGKFTPNFSVSLEYLRHKCVKHQIKPLQYKKLQCMRIVKKISQ